MLPVGVRLTREDRAWANQWNWSVGARGYVMRAAGRGKAIYLHVEIAARHGVVGPYIDHKDRERLNNRPRNLRAATMRQQQQNRGLQRQNTSGFKGVHWNGERSCFQAHITTNAGKHTYLGRFPDAKSAARAYDAAAISEFKEFALTNERLGLL